MSRSTENLLVFIPNNKNVDFFFIVGSSQRRSRELQLPMAMGGSVKTSLLCSVHKAFLLFFPSRHKTETAHSKEETFTWRLEKSWLCLQLVNETLLLLLLLRVWWLFISCLMFWINKRMTRRHM